jgi:hypothetical protein
MKISANLLVAALCLMLAASCKKSPVTPPPTGSGTKNSPNFVAQNFKWDAVTVGGWVEDGLIFYDLNHDDNKDKKYFVVKIASFAGTTSLDSFKIIKGPLPIDSAATNWPAHVKSCGYGYNTDMYVNARTRMKVSSRTADGRLIYVYDSISPTLFTGPQFSGRLAGKTPQGLSFIRASGLPGGAIAWQFWSYFKEETYLGNLTGGGSGGWSSGAFSNMFAATPAYDWVNVNNVAFFKNEYGWNTHIFFDFKNWRYFTWKESCPTPTDCSSITVSMSGYASLDKFLKWPEGWGKP